MFNDNSAQVETADSTPCRPDPEKILARIRTSKEETQDALDKAFILGRARIPNHRDIDKGMTILVGSLTIRMWELDVQEEKVLNQINEEAKES